MSNTVVHCIRVKVLKTFLNKTIGLIGHDRPTPIFFKTRFGIHTFGMKFPIDVIIIDRKNRIVSYKIGLVPNRIFLWNPCFDGVIELPDATIVQMNMKVSDTIKLSFISA